MNSFWAIANEIGYFLGIRGWTGYILIGLILWAILFLYLLVDKTLILFGCGKKARTTIFLQRVGANWLNNMRKWYNSTFANNVEIGLGIMFILLGFGGCLYLAK